MLAKHGVNVVRVPAATSTPQGEVDLAAVRRH